MPLLHSAVRVGRRDGHWPRLRREPDLGHRGAPPPRSSGVSGQPVAVAVTAAELRSDEPRDLLLPAEGSSGSSGSSSSSAGGARAGGASHDVRRDARTGRAAVSNLVSVAARSCEGVEHILAIVAARRSRSVSVASGGRRLVGRQVHPHTHCVVTLAVPASSARGAWAAAASASSSSAASACRAAAPCCAPVLFSKMRTDEVATLGAGWLAGRPAAPTHHPLTHYSPTRAHFPGPSLCTHFRGENGFVHTFSRNY